MSSYNPAIPQSNDARAQSQSQILANFQAINTVWANNHVKLTGDNELVGMHNVLTMRPIIGNNPPTDPTTSSSQVSLYNKIVSSIPELFFRPASNGTPIQLTYPSISTPGGATQYSFIPGPFVVFCGFLTAPTNNVPVALNPTTNLRYVGLTAYNASGSPTVHLSPLPTNINSPMGSFTPQWQAGATIPILYYMAIGQ